MDEEKVHLYFEQEKRGAVEVMHATLGQQQRFAEAMEEFRISIANIEGIIKAHNGGEMPTVIKNNSSF